VIAIGIMSGTSADGMDAAAIELDDGPHPKITLLAHVARDHPDSLRVLRLRREIESKQGALSAQAWTLHAIHELDGSGEQRGPCPSLLVHSARFCDTCLLT